jgi:hypothetical protein
MLHLRPTAARTSYGAGHFTGTVCGDAGDMTDDAGAVTCEKCQHWHRMANLDTFTNAYIEAALWSTNDESTPDGGVPFDNNYSVQDIAPETLARMVADCDAFQKAHSEHFGAEGAHATAGDGWAQAGHDFWLTREGHGAGFWDGDWKEPGASIMCEAAKAFGEFPLYLSDPDEDGDRTICHG